MKAEEFDRLFDEGKENITQYFDLSKARRPNQEPKRVAFELPQWMVNSLDQEAKRVGVTRQSLVKVWLAERLKRAGVDEVRPSRTIRS